MVFNSMGFAFLSSLAGDDNKNGMAWWRFCLLEIYVRNRWIGRLCSNQAIDVRRLEVVSRGFCGL